MKKHLLMTIVVAVVVVGGYELIKRKQAGA